MDEQVEWVEPNYTYEQHQVQEAEYKNGNLWVSYSPSVMTVCASHMAFYAWMSSPELLVS